MQFRNFLLFCVLCTITWCSKVKSSTCVSDDDCDRDALLKCNLEKQKCECNSDILVYDNRKRKCVLYIWAPCNNSLEIQHECVTNAICKMDIGYSGYGSCQCKPNYFDNEKQECERKRPFNGNCTKEYGCQLDGNGYSLTCKFNGIEGRCACDSFRSIFIGGICYVPAGNSCSDNEGSCVPNSHCEFRPSLGKVCSCNSEFFQTSSGTCELKRSHGEACDFNSDCETKLMCNLNEICECEKPLYIYDSFQESCVLSLGSECDGRMSKNSSQCVTSATCKRQSGIQNRKLFTCQCDGGKERNGTCLISHGGKCGIENKKCNEEEQGTICNEGICECRDGVFDEQKEKCVSGAFGICEDATLDCISNSHCADDAGLRGGNKNMKKCVCDDSFVPVDYECLATIGQPCNYTEINKNGHSGRSIGNCDPIASLRCINGTCQCRGGEEYDSVRRKCRGLAGSFCELYDENYCVENAECILRYAYSMNRGRCECKSGWEDGEDRKCST
ncbi:unnamed protein product [Orchesella dallaii]|uniref:EGF-like domain-containing protein n=1 Tax=Orchesella dallaii TaxID=48710 RepID=A0ABP1RVQ1_9HEXA